MCAQRAGVDRGLDGGSREIVLFEINGRVHAGEGALDGHNTHVLGGKLHLGVHRIDGPGHGRSPFLFSCLHNCLIRNSMPGHFLWCNYPARIRVC